MKWYWISVAGWLAGFLNTKVGMEKVWGGGAGGGQIRGQIRDQTQGEFLKKKKKNG